MNMLNETDYMSSCSGDSENNLILNSTKWYEWYNDAAATLDGTPRASTPCS